MSILENYFGVRVIALSMGFVALEAVAQQTYVATLVKNSRTYYGKARAKCKNAAANIHLCQVS